MLHWKVRIYGVAAALVIVAAYGGGMTWWL
jgi:hypothetical protein